MKNKFDLPQTQLISNENEVAKKETFKSNNYASDTTILNNGLKITVTCIRNKRSAIVNSCVFKIGSSASADLCIDDNLTISRIHAIITLEDDGCFYILDNCSSNHSYFEGVLAKPNVKYRLFSGSRFVLSDEEFIFIIR